MCLQRAVHVTNGSELRHCQAHWKTKAVHLFKILSTVILFSELSKPSMCHDAHGRRSQLDPEPHLLNVRVCAFTVLLRIPVFLYLRLKLTRELTLNIEIFMLSF